ncbi:AAA family ATPase [Pseudoramibacter alactolyticus]
MDEQKLLPAVDSGFSTNKDVAFKSIDAISIDSFRSLKNKKLPLGENITLISGKNGTMKSTLLGLIAHPFSSPNNAKDLYGKDLKTDMREVFKLSPEKDKEIYRYNLEATGILNGELIPFSEPIRVYPRDNRHRVTVGKDNSRGLGNFSLNTCYVNLKRLFPIIDTTAKNVGNSFNLSSEYREFLYKGYLRILQRESFNNAVPISDQKEKYTFGPNHDQYYDYNSISSGEDNLGNILLKLWAFMKHPIHPQNNQTECHKCLNGIFCIDEIEAGLHPVAQEKLFDFLLSWSQKYNVQIVATTHSLYLIQYALKIQLMNNNDKKIYVNMISTNGVSKNNYNFIVNPDYNTAYKELTFKNTNDFNDLYKVSVLCEDEMAKKFISTLMGRKITRHIEFIYGITGDPDNPGTSANSLNALIKNGQKLIKDCIVIYDADQNIEKIKKRFPQQAILKLPIESDLPVEKAIVLYIYNLPGDDQFFTIKTKKEKGYYISSFADQNILHLKDIEFVKNSNVKPYKFWADQHKKMFNSALNLMIKSNENLYTKFKNDLITYINKILSEKSLPAIV